MKTKIFMLAFLVAWFGARDCYGQYFQNRLAKRQRITSAPYSFRYFFPHKYGLSRGWYRSKKDYWKLHNKRYYYQTMEEAIEAGMPLPTMPTMSTMDTDFATPDNMGDDDLFSPEPTYPMTQEPPTALPQQPPYMQPAAMQSYPYNMPVQTPGSVGVQTPESMSVQTPGGMPVQTSEGVPVQTPESMPVQTPESMPVQTQESMPVQTPGGMPVQRPEGMPVQTPYQTGPLQYQPGFAIVSPQATMQPKPVPQYPAMQPRPPVYPQQKLASFPSIGTKAKFEKHDSSRICPPGPPLKHNPRFKNCLVIGDSIAIGYLMTVKVLLRGMCQVQHAPFARGSGAIDSRHGVKCLSMLLKTAAMAPTRYDAIVFNFGMHDIDYSKRFPEERVYLHEYKKNLRILKEAFLETGAKVAYALTTPYMSSKKRNERIKEYNKAAASVMGKGHKVPVVDMYDIITKRCGQPANKKHCPIMKRPGDVHYNEEGCQLLGVRVAATFATLINQNGTKNIHSPAKGRRRFLKHHYHHMYSSANAVTCPDTLTRCPVGTTCCESFLSLTGYGCCMMPNAVSCEDKWHCCPSGSICSPTCNVRECHCVSYVQSSKGKLIKKKTKAKVQHHPLGMANILKKKIKSASHPLVRLLKKWKKGKQKMKKKDASIPDLSEKLKNFTLGLKKKKKKKESNAMDQPKTENNSIDVELGNLIEHHHKSDFVDLKNYLKESNISKTSTNTNLTDISLKSSHQHKNGAQMHKYHPHHHHNHHRRNHHRHNHHHHHHLHHHHHHQSFEQETKDDFNPVDDGSGESIPNEKHSESKKISFTKKKNENMKSGSMKSGSMKSGSMNSGSIYSGADEDSSGESDVMSHNAHKDMSLGSGEEFVRGSGTLDQMEPLDDIQGITGSGMRDLIEPVSPFEKEPKSSKSAETIKNKIEIQVQGHRRNNLKSHSSSNSAIKDDDLMSRNDVTNNSSHAMRDWSRNTDASSNSIMRDNRVSDEVYKNLMHDSHAVNIVTQDNLGLRDADAEDLLSSEFSESDSSDEHGFDLMISASTSGTKDAASTGKDKQSDNKNISDSKPPVQHAELMSMSRESWVKGESGEGFKDDDDNDEDDVDENVRDDVTSTEHNLNPHHSQNASGHINKELRNELVALDNLMESELGSSEEFGSSDLMEKPVTDAQSKTQDLKTLHKNKDDLHNTKLVDKPLLEAKSVDQSAESNKQESRFSDGKSEKLKSTELVETPVLDTNNHSTESYQRKTQNSTSVYLNNDNQMSAKLVEKPIVKDINYGANLHLKNTEVVNNPVVEANSRKIKLQTEDSNQTRDNTENKLFVDLRAANSSHEHTNITPIKTNDSYFTRHNTLMDTKWLDNRSASKFGHESKLKNQRTENPQEKSVDIPGGKNISVSQTLTKNNSLGVKKMDNRNAKNINNSNIHKNNENISDISFNWNKHYAKLTNSQEFTRTEGRNSPASVKKKESLAANSGNKMIDFDGINEPVDLKRLTEFPEHGQYHQNINDHSVGDFQEIREKSTKNDQNTSRKVKTHYSSSSQKTIHDKEYHNNQFQHSTVANMNERDAKQTKVSPNALRNTTSNDDLKNSSTQHSTFANTSSNVFTANNSKNITQNQSQQIAKMLNVDKEPKRKSWTQNSSKRFSLHNRNFFNSKKHLFSSERKRLSSSLGFRNGFKGDRNVLSIKHKVLGETDDISNDSLEIEQSSLEGSSDSEEYLD